MQSYALALLQSLAHEEKNQLICFLHLSHFHVYSSS